MRNKLIFATVLFGLTLSPAFGDDAEQSMNVMALPIPEIEFCGDAVDVWNALKKEGFETLGTSELISEKNYVVLYTYIPMVKKKTNAFLVLKVYDPDVLSKDKDATHKKVACMAFTSINWKLGEPKNNS